MRGFICFCYVHHVALMIPETSNNSTVFSLLSIKKAQAHTEPSAFCKCKAHRKLHFVQILQTVQRDKGERRGGKEQGEERKHLAEMTKMPHRLCDTDCSCACLR